MVMVVSRNKIKQYRALTIVAIVAAILVVALAIVLGKPQSISDDYFVSDDTKLVAKLDASQAAYESGEYEPAWTYIVYEYKGDEITNAKVYFAYDDDEQAREANAHISLDNKVWAYEKQLNGKYIVFSLFKYQYVNLTTEYVRGIID